jgi:hypothetical protein
MRREYFIDWACEYDLIYYPFDTQGKVEERIKIRKENLTFFLSLVYASWFRDSYFTCDSLNYTGFPLANSF